MNSKLPKALNLVAEERIRQDEKWGDQSGHNMLEWLSILMEEVGELAEAINETFLISEYTKPEKSGIDAIRKEAVQVAAVAVAIVENVLPGPPKEAHP